MIGLTRRVGTGVLGFIEGAGMMLLLLCDTVASFARYRLRIHLLAEQVYFIGVRSLSVIIITGAFTGAVFAAQIQFQFASLGLNSGTGPVVSLAMCRELGPVLAALMVAGRVGSAMAAELATMKIGEQIDALRALAVYPIEYLVVPRMLGMAIAMPILTGVCIGTGIFAGYFVYTVVIGLDGAYYMHYTLVYTEARDIIFGLIKGFFFGIMIALVACHMGLNSDKGAAGVGKATTDAVVVASLCVLISNFFFTFLLNALIG